MPKYKVNIHYSSFNSFTVEAKNEEDAITIAHSMQIDLDQILSNLGNWEEADEAFEINENYFSEKTN